LKLPSIFLINLLWHTRKGNILAFLPAIKQKKDCRLDVRSMLGTNQLFRYQVVELKGADLDHALDQISSSSNFYRNPMEAEIIKRKVEHL